MTTQPSVSARMIDGLLLAAGDHVLEIGTSLGFQTWLLQRGVVGWRGAGSAVLDADAAISLAAFTAPERVICVAIHIVGATGRRPLLPM